MATPGSDVEPEPQTDETGPPAAETALGRRGASRFAIVSLAIVAVAAIVLAVLAYREAVDERDRADRLATQDATERDVAAVAAAFGEALLSYDRTDLAAARAAIADTATDSFLATYDETFLALEPVISELQAVGVGQADTVYVADVGDDTAKAVVVLDQRVESTAGTREVTGVHLQVDLVREDDGWRVLLASRIGELGSALAPVGDESDDPEPPASTTTSAPPG